jgi:hypothetical protein
MNPHESSRFVSRSPHMHVPERVQVLAATPVPGIGECAFPTYAARVHGDEKGQADGQRGLLGLTIGGVVFLSGWPADRWNMVSERNPEDAAKCLIEAPTSEALPRALRWMQEAAHQVQSIILPAPLIVAIEPVQASRKWWQPSHALLVITIEHDDGALERHPFAITVPNCDARDAIISVYKSCWIVRLLYEALMLVILQLHFYLRRMPRDTIDRLVCELIPSWYGYGPSPETVRMDITDALRQSGLDGWGFADLELEAYFHLQRFQKVDCLNAEFAPFWQLVRRVPRSSEHLCVGCLAQSETRPLLPPGDSVCPRCNTAAPWADALSTGPAI